MISSTHRNHLHFYETNFNNERVFNLVIGDSDQFGTFQYECIRAAKLIAEQFNGETIWITLSGGMDSEVVARAFLKANVNIKCAIMAFENNLNAHDIRLALNFCKEYNLPYKIFYLNLDDFYSRNGHLRFAKAIRCSSPQIATHLWLAENLPGPFVFSGNPSLLIWSGHTSLTSDLKTDLNNYSLLEPPPENNFCMDRLNIRSNLRGISNFYFYTPELMMSASCGFSNPFMTYLFYYNFCKNVNRIHASEHLNLLNYYSIINSLKFQFYYAAGFNIRMRPNKFTGFELLHYKFGRADILDPHARQMDGLNLFNNLYRQPMQAIANQTPNVRISYGLKNNKLLQNKTQSWLNELSKSKEWVLSALKDS